MKPKIYRDKDHPIDQALIDRDALAIIHKLKEAGFVAYLVGGSVRDLLLGKTPKDYDISTSARPEEVKQVFGRKCILIGRRFRLAHIRQGNKIFEVATFRAGDTSDELITQDNVWGTEQEDVLRRDFTINGLFYEPEQHMVIDYVGGRNDLVEHTLHTIGDPDVRFKQDPVRMLRLLKFQARFGFKASPDVQNSLIKTLPEISKSSPARILEEMLRMLESCASAPFFKLLLQSGMMGLLFPEIETAFKGPKGEEMLAFLDAADKINKQSTKFPIERGVLCSALIYPLIEEEINTQFTSQGKTPHMGEILGTTSTLVHRVILNSFYHFPRRISALMGYTLSTQYRLTPLLPKKQHPIRLFRTREFPQALRLLKIRATVHPQLQQTYVEWREHYRHYLRNEEEHPHHRPHIHHAPHHRKKPKHPTARKQGLK